MNINIGSVARECREYLGLTQREAAKALGISVVHLCNIEKGRAKPSADLADKFTDIWGVDLYVFAWCQNGDVSNLPESMKIAAQALTNGWKEQLIAAKRCSGWTLGTMLYICYDKLLARHLSTDRETLREVLANANKYYRELRLHDPLRPDKPRDVVDVHGILSKFQNTFYNRVLIRKLPVSMYSHGCIRGRSIKSNAQAHQGSTFVFKADISNFFPSITQQRVYRLFKDRLKCSPPVAKLCTRLCTYDHHLALGLVSSPILADQIMQPIDERIGNMCRKAGLQYTRFVDDVTISGPYDLAKSAVPKSLNSIFEDNGFALNLNKLEFGTLSESVAITGIRQNRRGNLDVKIEFFEEVERQLEDSRTLSRREQFNDSRPYYTRNQIFGRIQHIRWIHKQRGERLLSEFNKINWEVVEEEATQQRIMAVKKRLSKRPTPQNA